MAKSFNVYVEIAGRIGSSFTNTMSAVESKIKGLGAHYKAGAAAARDAAKQIADSYEGAAAMAAGAGIAFSAKHAMHDGAELAHELFTLKAAGRNAHQVAEGLAEANRAIAEMPTATLENGIKILNETTGAYGDYKHAVENLKFNSKLGDVLKNTVGTEDPAHEIGSLIKMLEIRGTASNPEKYRAEAEKLAQAMVFYGGRLKADDLYLFASNAQVGVKQLNERFLTKIAPALIQEMGGDKVGTGLTAFRTIISGRKITDQKQAQAWKDLGLLNDKDIIRNKKGDVTGWKDGAIANTRLAYQDPMQFIQDVILPKLQKQGVDINDPIALGQKLNTLFKNTKANAFVTAIAGAVDRARLKKDEALIGDVKSLNDNYEQALLNDPKMAEFAIHSAMKNIGATLTLGLQGPFAIAMVKIARGFNYLANALIAHPEAAKVVAGLFAALTALAAVRLLNFVFGVSGLVRALAMLAIGAPLSLAGRLIGVARGIAAVSAAGALSGLRGLRLVGMALWSLAMFPLGLAGRLRGVAAGMMALQAVGGSRLVFATMAGGLGRLGLSVLAFPLVALRGVAMGIASGFRMIGLAMWSLVANPVGAVVAAIVVALAALSLWVYNNWTGITTFFSAFGKAFMANLGPGATGALTTLVGWLKSAWDWLNKLLGPIDEGGKKWASWGEAAGKGAAGLVNALAALPAEIAKLAQEAWDALVNFDWAAAGLAIVDKIKSGLSGLGGYLVDKLNPFGGDAPAPAKEKFGPAAPPKRTPPMLRATPLAGARALGGPVQKGLPYLIGERGPEIFVPDASGTVKTNGELNGLVGRAGRGPSVDVSALSEASDKASATGAVFHDAIDATRRPIVDTTSLDAATEKATKLQGILAAIDKSPIAIGEGTGAGTGGEALSDAAGSASGGGGRGMSSGGGGGFGSSEGGGSHHAGRRGFMGRGRGSGDGSFTGSAGVGGWWTKDRIEHGVERLMKEAKLSRAGAEGLVSRWATVEAAGGPTAVNPSSGAAGIGQWLGARKHGFGKDYDSQLTHAIGELNGSESRAAKQLRSAVDVRQGAIGASMYERAEGYNPRTGIDRFTGKSQAGNGALAGVLKGTPAGAADAEQGAPGSGAGAVDKGLALLGRGGREVGRAFGVHITPGEWCAEFVNGALKASGVKGTNSAMAGSFMEWGHAVATNSVKKGDVIVDGDPAGHVSLATGATRMRHGRLQIETLNGNWGHSHKQSAVKKDWLTAQPWVHARRGDAPPPPKVAAAPQPAKAPEPARPIEVPKSLATPKPVSPLVGLHAGKMADRITLAGARATGGPVGSGLSFLVGEHGPEIFTPSATGRIATNATLNSLADVGRDVTNGTGEPVAPSPSTVAKARPAAGASSKPPRGDFHAGVHNWHIHGSEPSAVRQQVESVFDDLLRQYESDQRGSLSD